MNTKSSWLHGDKRGFRSRRHRIHSSGDYKNPPPIGEHKGLYEYHRKRAGKLVRLDDDARTIVLEAFVLKMRILGHQILAGSAGDKHVHALCELPISLTEVKAIVGKCKQYASHAVRETLPGSIWARGGTFKQIKDRSHQKNVFNYIRSGQEDDAVVWSILPDEDWMSP